MVVANVRAITIPTYALAVIRSCLLHGVKQWLHSLVVRTFRLDQIDNIELIGSVLFHVLHTEVEPLGVSGRVVVILQDKVVLVLADPIGSLKITRLKATFKYQCCVFVIVLLVISLQFCVVSVKFWNFLVECV